MATATTSKASWVTDPVEREALVRADLKRYHGLTQLLEELELYPEGLDRAIAQCRPPLHVSPPPSRKARRELGLYFDVEEVRRFLVFARGLRHVKGRWGGQPLVPDLWQIVYLIAPVIGLRQADGARYYREVFLEVPRKNGKSTLAAAFTLYLLLADSNLRAGRLFEPGAEVYAAATTTAQALNVFTPAENMAKRSRYASKLAVLTNRALVVEATLSKYEVISGDPAKAEEKMGGNVSGAVVDETHVHRDRRLIDTIETGVSARQQPLILHLTTAGTDTDGTIYAEKHDLALAQAEGKTGDLRTWSVVYTIPAALEKRWADPEVWAIANPGLGISVSVEYLEDSAAKAQRSEARRLSFCRLHLNVRSSNVVRWLDLPAYDRSGAFARPSWSELRNRVAYMGLDLSSSTDLSALVAVIPRWVEDPEDPGFEIEVLDVVCRAWTPLERLAGRAPKDREILGQLLETPNPLGPPGTTVLTGCPGETIDYDLIEAAAVDLADHLEVERLSFDRWGARQITDHLRQEGLNVVELGQGFAGMSPPMKETERIILDRRFRHGGNPLLRYAFSNMRAEVDAAGNVKPHRKKSEGHIDPAVAAIMAVDGYVRDTSGSSVYEERGIATA